VKVKSQVVQQGVEIQVEAVDGIVELQFRLTDESGFALVADRELCHICGILISWVGWFNLGSC